MMVDGDGSVFRPSRSGSGSCFGPLRGLISGHSDSVRLLFLLVVGIAIT